MKIQFKKTENNPAAVHGVKVPYAPAKRRTAQWRWYLILLIVSSPLLYFLFRMFLSFVVVSAQGYISLDKIAINSTAAGILDSLAVEIGQDIASGVVIAHLYSPELNGQQHLLKTGLASLERATSFQDSAETLLLRNRLEITAEVLASQAKYHQTMRFLFDQGAATLAELAEAEERKNKARSDYNDALYEQRLFEEKKARQSAIDRPAFENERSRLTAQLKALEEQQGRLSQVSPHAGRVLDIFSTPGEMLAPGAPILLLGRSDKPYVMAYLSPKYVKYGRKGRPAQVKLPDGKVLQAVVDEDANLTKRLPADLSSPIGSRDLMLLVKLALSAPLPALQWVDGLPVNVRFSF